MSSLRKKIRNIIEKLVESTLFISSTVTTLAVLLIVVFLFKEGWGLFGTSTMESGYVLAVNKNTKVNYLKAADIKNVFDQNITNWKQLGGTNDSIVLLRMEDIANYFTEEQIGANYENLPRCINKILDSVPNTLAFVNAKYFKADDKVKTLETEKTNLNNFFTGKEWYPTATPSAQFGVYPLIMGTLWVSFFAILFALPLGLAAAVYLAEIANDKTRNILKPVIELLAGIPSVVYGFFGLIIIVPLIQQVFKLDVGESALAGSIILGIMALPTIITVSEDAMRNTPRSMKEASLALGASKWQTIYKIVIPYSISGITAAAILGIGRAIGETMAVLMVTGNSSIIPHNILQSVRTIPATIAAELGETSQGGMHYKALFALGCILFIMTLIINMTVEYISSKRRMGKR